MEYVKRNSALATVNQSLNTQSKLIWDCLPIVRTFAITMQLVSGVTGRDRSYKRNFGIRGGFIKALESRGLFD